jgi:hypothetical protein
MSLKREIGIDAAEVEGFRWGHGGCISCDKISISGANPIRGQFYPLLSGR